MTGNEYLAKDIHSLQKIFSGIQQEVKDLGHQKDALVLAISREPKELLEKLERVISERQSTIRLLDSEIEVKTEVAHTIETSGSSTHKVYSEVAKRHHDSASNALLRLKTAHEGMVKVKIETECHEKARQVALARRKSAEDAAEEAEKHLTTTKYKVSASQEEHDQILQEVEKIRSVLERYKADKLNLEAWEARLKDKETYLVALMKRFQGPN